MGTITQLHQLSMKVSIRGRVGQSQNSDGDNNTSKTLNTESTVEINVARNNW